MDVSNQSVARLKTWVQFPEVAKSVAPAPWAILRSSDSTCESYVTLHQKDQLVYFYIAVSLYYCCHCSQNAPVVF